MVVRSVGGQPVNLAARLDVGPAKDGSVDALITPSSTSYVEKTARELRSTELIMAIENCARMISWLKIHEPRYCSPPRVPTLKTMSSSLPGVVEMAGVAVVVAQNVGARVATSPQEWRSIDFLLCFVLLEPSLNVALCLSYSVITSLTSHSPDTVE